MVEIPVSIVSFRRALTLVNSDKAIVLENYPNTLIKSSGFHANLISPGYNINRSLNSVIEMPIPSVIQCTKSTYMPKKFTKILPFNRKNVYIRDNGRCQYCNKKVSLAQFSFDHVIPRCAGGKTCWENIVIACVHCNSSKGPKSVAKFKHPITPPYAPRLDKAAPAHIVNKIAGEIPHETWIDYLYWHVILEP
jgi:5-methylcytosine-specific restriction endonuclease McrA